MSLFQRGMLAATLGLGVLAGLARAEEPELLTPPQAVESQSAEPAAVQGSCNTGKPSLLQRIRPANWFGSHQPIGCYAHHNDFSCGSLRSELFFIFGSCRHFYGQRCLKGPPPLPVPQPGFPPPPQPGDGVFRGPFRGVFRGGVNGDINGQVNGQAGCNCN